jgi:transcriptional regulator with XRE-family HTH domain
MIMHGARVRLQVPSAIGQRIRAVRQQAGLSLERFAAALGCSRRALINWEQNAAEPPIGVLPKLRDLYDVDPEWIVRGEDLVPRSRYRPTDWIRFDRIADDVAAACTQVGIKYDDKVITGLVRDLFDDEPADYDANSKQLRRTLLAIARGKA